MYNILYYLELENCRLDCGTEIAFKNLDSDSDIIFFKLPIIKGLILALKDNCFAHKSPVVTYTEHTWSQDIKEKNEKIDKFSKELNIQKLKECLEKYFNSKTDIKINIDQKALEIDCKQFIKYAYQANDEEYNNILKQYEDDNIDFFNELFRKWKMINLIKSTYHLRNHIDSKINAIR